MLRNREDAEDVLQETFATIFEKAATQDPAQGSIRGWAFAIARNHALQMIRRRKYSEIPTLPEPEGPEDPGEQVMKSHSADEIIETLHSLPLDVRLSFIMRECLDLSYSEIADLTGRNVNQISSDIFRARTHLRKSLGSEK